MAFLPGVFGGDNVVGFMGGGRYIPDRNNYQIGGSGYMNAANTQGSQQAQGYINQYDPIAQQEQARQQQQQLAQSLFGQLSGNQPSVAQQQLNQTTQGNIANAFAMAQANPNNPAAARMVANNVGNLNQQAAGQGALLRAQEMQNAQGMLGNVLGGMRSQDTGLYGQLSNTAQGYLQNQEQLQNNQAQLNAQYEQAKLAGFTGAQQNAIGPKVLQAAGQIGAAFAGKAHGGPIPGYATGGDSTANDVVPSLLSPGEIVLPRSVALADDAPEKAKLFVMAIRKKHGLKKAA